MNQTCNCNSFKCHDCQTRIEKQDNEKELLSKYTFFNHMYYGCCNCSNFDCVECQTQKLTYCVNCGLSSPNTTLHCPNYRVSNISELLIKEGALEYFKGKWWTANE